jgi:hypothetical protein
MKGANSDRSSRKGYEDPLDYLRDASNFSKSGVTRNPPEPDRYFDDGTVLWKNLNIGEFVIVDRNGKIRTYGFNEY